MTDERGPGAKEEEEVKGGRGVELYGEGDGRKRMDTCEREKGEIQYKDTWLLIKGQANDTRKERNIGKNLHSLNTTTLFKKFHPTREKMTDSPRTQEPRPRPRAQALYHDQNISPCSYLSV